MDNNSAMNILQQLNSNPQMVNQLQGLLALVNGNNDTNTSSSSNNSYGNHHQNSSQDTLLGSNVSSPAVSLTTSASHRGVNHNNSNSMQKQLEHFQRLAEQKDMKLKELRQQNELLRGEQGAQVADLQKRLQLAEQKYKTAEGEVLKLHQRIEKLSETVSHHRAEMNLAKERHQMELEEERQKYTRALEKQEKLQEEVLRQVLKTNQLKKVAGEFEETVQKARGLREVPKNIRVGYAVKSSGSKKDEEDADEIHTDDHHPYKYKERVSHGNYNANTRSNPVKRERTAEEALYEEFHGHAYQPRSGGSSSSHPQRVKTEGSEGLQQRQRYASSEVLTISPSTSTAMPKASTLLTAAPRTISRNQRRRHTPKTPSMTNADRVHSRSPVPHNSRSVHYTQNTNTNNNNNGVRPSANFVQQFASPQPPLHPGITAAKSAQAASRVAGRLQPSQPLRGVPNVPSGNSSPAVGTTRSPTPVNPSRGLAMPRRFIFTGLKEEEVAQLREDIAAIGQDAYPLTSELDEPPPRSCTHVVVRGAPRSVKALCGLVAGMWLVSPEYIYDSKKKGFWLDEMEEGGLRVYPPQVRFQVFLLQMENDALREKIAQVIEYGGGEIVSSSSSNTNKNNSNNGQVVVITSGDDLLRFATQVRN